MCEHFINLTRHQLIGVGETLTIVYKEVPQSSSTIAFSNLLSESIKRLRPGGVKMSPVDVQQDNRRLVSKASITEPSASELYGEDGAAYTDVLAVKTLSHCEEVELAQGLAQNLTDLLQKDYFMLGANACPRILFILISLHIILKILSDGLAGCFIKLLSRSSSRWSSKEVFICKLEL